MMQKKIRGSQSIWSPNFPRCRVPSIRCHTQWRGHGLKHGRKKCGWRWGESTSNCVVLSVTWYQNSQLSPPMWSLILVKFFSIVDWHLLIRTRGCFEPHQSTWWTSTLFRQFLACWGWCQFPLLDLQYLGRLSVMGITDCIALKSNPPCSVLFLLTFLDAFSLGLFCGLSGWGYQKPPNRSCAKGALCDFCHLHGGKRGKKSRQARNMTTWPVSESQVQWEIQWISRVKQWNAVVSIHQEHPYHPWDCDIYLDLPIKVNHSCR